MGASPALNESERASLYAELASGAETGWDYGARWCKQSTLNVTNNYPALRTLNTRAIIPVDLNSLLSGAHSLVSTNLKSHPQKVNALTPLSSPITIKCTPPRAMRTAQSPKMRPPKRRTTAQ